MATTAPPTTVPPTTVVPTTAPPTICERLCFSPMCTELLGTGELFVNDTVRLVIDTNLNLSGYTTLQMGYMKPDGSTGCWAATIYPTDNTKMYYETQIGDIDQAGEWLMQGVALASGVKVSGKIWCRFKVLNMLVANCTTAPPTTAPPTTPIPTTAVPTTAP